MSDSHFQLLSQHNDGQYRFHSIKDFLGIAPPYSTCLAHAPYGRNAPHCSRLVNPNNRAKARGLLVRLSDTPFPSSNAGNLLKELSSCAVCGITKLHQTKASEVYQKWCKKLWEEYLRANGVDPRFCRGPPALLTRDTWEDCLEDLLAEQQDVSEEEYLSDDASEDSDEVYSDGDANESDGSNDDIDSLDGVLTPDSTTSAESDDEPDYRSDSRDFVTALDSTILDDSEAFSNGDSRPISHDSSERSFTAHEPTVTAQRQPRATFSVYRDPGPHQAEYNTHDATRAQLLPRTGLVGDAQLQAAPTASRRPRLGILNPNIPVSSDSRRTSVSSLQGPAEANQLSSQMPEYTHGARSNDPGNVAECIDGGNSSTRSQPSQRSVHGRNEVASASQQDVGFEAPLSETIYEAAQTEGGETPHEVEGDAELRPLPVSRPIPHDRTDTQGIHEDTEQSYEVNTSSEVDAESDSDEDQPSQQSSDEEREDFLANLFPFSDIPDNELVQVTSSNSHVQIGALIPGHFRPYPKLSPLLCLKDLLNRIPNTVVKQKRTSGFIYAYSRPSLPGFLKIGYTSDRVERHRPRQDPVAYRLAAWETKCGYPVVEVFRAYIPCAVERIESFVHATLREHRRIEHPPCIRCTGRASRAASRGGHRGAGGAHKEWFEIDVETAQRVVELWRLFSEERPYDRFGRLVDFWCETVERDWEQVEEGDTVENWVEKLPRMIEELRRDVFRNLPCSIWRLSTG